MARKTRKDTDESEKPKTSRSVRSRKEKEMKAEDIGPKEIIAIKEEETRIEIKPEKAAEDRIKGTPKRKGVAEKTAIQGPFIGVPSMIWSTYGNRGNFEVVVPLASGGMAHYWRDNDNENLPWQGPEVFGREAGMISGVSIIQSNFGEQGNLELVAVDVGGKNLMHFWRDSGPSFDWHEPNKISRDSLVPLFSGNPAFIQSRSGHRGNFEVVVPRAEGGFSYYWRDNDDPELSWHGPSDFATDAGIFGAVTLIQSNFEDHMEMAARSGDQLFFFWRGSDAESQWNGTELITTGIAGTPSMIQSSNEGKGNFELVTPLRSGGLGYYWRDNDDPHLHWYGPFMFAMNTGKVDAVSLIQSDFGEKGNLELVAQIDNQLAFFWRDSGIDRRWNGPQYLFLTNIS
ncbi:MAG: hypothetical protein ACE14P_13610 [Methanotrichaceae archaeon]